MRKAPQCLSNTTELFRVNVRITRQKFRRLLASLNCMLFQNRYVILHCGGFVPAVSNILNSDDLYRPEHRLVFQASLRLYAKGAPIDYLAVEEELRKTSDFGKIEHRYLLSLIDATFNTARAEYHANIIKEKANLRKLIELSDVLQDEAERGEKSSAEIITCAESQLSSWCRSALPSKSSQLADYSVYHLKAASTL